jgi:peptidoglycan/LPS O-acetylase OafA/YrhL
MVLRTKEFNRSLASAAFTVILVFIGLYQFIPVNNTAKYIAFVTLFSLALPYLFMQFKNNELDRKIGEFSYPVYISHVFVILVVNVFGSKFGMTNETVLSLLILAATFTLSFLLIKFVGEPIDRYRAKRILNKDT